MVIDGPIDPPLTRANDDPARAPVRWAAIMCGIFFLMIGFAGFVPAVTWNLHTIEMGYGSEAMVLGIFQVSFLHNIIHLLLGAAVIAQSRFSYTARRILRIGGGLAAALWLFGLLVDLDSSANFLALNAADNWAYFALAIVMIGLSFLSGQVTPDSPRVDHHLRSSTMS